MDLVAKCDVKGVLDVVIIRKGVEVDRMKTNNSFFGNAAAKALAGVTTDAPTKVIMTSGSTNFILPHSSAPSATGAVVTYVSSSSTVETGTTDTWSFTLRDGATDSTTGNTWASAVISPISSQVYYGDTFQITWQHTVSGLTDPGNNTVADFLCDGTGEPANIIGVADDVWPNGSLDYATASTFGTASAVGDITTVTGSFPNSSGDAFPSTNNNYGYIGRGSLAWAQLTLSATQIAAASNRRANLTLKVDFS